MSDSLLSVGSSIGIIEGVIVLLDMLVLVYTVVVGFSPVKKIYAVRNLL